MILSPDGVPLFVEAPLIELSEAELKLSLHPANPKLAASIGSLKRTTRDQPIAVAYGTQALWARVIEVKQVVSNDREVWNLFLKPDEGNSGSSLFEMNFADYTAGDIAELRARRILLNEKFPATKQFGMNKSNMGFIDHAIEGGYGTGIIVKESPFPVLFSRLKNNESEFLKAARLFAILQLILTNTVERIHHLDLKLQEKETLSVTFEGQRRPQYSNEPPHIIKVEGECELDI